MTVKELKAALDKKKIPYPANANKKKLEKLFKKSEKPPVVVAPVVPPVVETAVLPVVETKQPETKGIDRYC